MLKVRTGSPIFQELLNSCIPYSRFYLGSFAFLLLSNLCMAYLPIFAKAVVDSGLDANFDLILILSAQFLATALVLAIFRVTSRILIYYACREQENDLRLRLHEKVLNLSSPDYLRLSRGDYMTLMLEDTTQVRLMVGFGLVQAANILLLYASSIPFMAYISGSLTLWCVAPYPLLLAWVAFTNHRLYYLNLAVKEKQAILVDFTTQAIQGIHVVKSHGCEDAVFSQYQKKANLHYDSLWSATRVDTIMLPVMICLAALGEWAVIHFGVPRIAEGTLSAGEFVAFHGYIGNLLFASISVGFGVSTFNRGTTSMHRLLQQFDSEDEIRSGKTLAEGPLKFSLGGIVHRYPGRHEAALMVHDLKLSEGESIGILGAVGSGKTTLFRLLTLQEVPTQGQISVNDQPLTPELFCSLREQVLHVSQDLFLLSRTIRENLEFGVVRTDSEIQKALEFACLLEDVRGFTDGLNTVVGERGVRLSTGQKQRICLARAWLFNPRILILDDCFSALDTVVEEQILKQLVKERGTNGLILASHRISTLKHCQRIIVLEHGQIVGDGTHSELLNSQQLYRSIWNLQQEFTE